MRRTTRTGTPHRPRRVARLLALSASVVLVTACTTSDRQDDPNTESTDIAIATTAAPVTTTLADLTPAEPPPSTGPDTTPVPVVASTVATTAPAPPTTPVPAAPPTGGPPGDPAMWPVVICSNVMAIAEEAGLPGDACAYIPGEFATFNYVAETPGVFGLRSAEMACYTATTSLGIGPLASPTFAELPLTEGTSGGNFDFAPPSEFWSSCHMQFASDAPLSAAGIDAVIRLGNAFLDELS